MNSHSGQPGAGMVDALKRASARRITVVTPFFGYARQDKKNRGREPISARLMSDLFATAGADRLMAVDLHTAQIQGFFDGPVDHLFALPILASYLEKKLDVSQVTVVAPDAGRVRVCERWTDRLGCPLAIIHKRRDPDVANQVRMFEVVGQVAGRTCILVDDMDIGDAIHASDLKLPPGVTLQVEPDTLVLHVIAQQAAEEPEAAEGEGEGEVPESVDSVADENRGGEEESAG